LSYRGKSKSSYGNHQKHGGSGVKKVGGRGKANEDAEKFRQWVYKQNPQAKEQREFFGKPISVYTSKEAIDDGTLVDLFSVRRSFVNLATSTLIAEGYKNPDGTINEANVKDLIAQGLHILGDQKKNESLVDYYHRLSGVGFASGKIELPNGDKQTVFLAKNDLNTYTIMLPADY
jgi:hypothetical protein